MNTNARTRIGSTPREKQRKGSILVMAALLLVTILAFAAFSIDYGYISLTKTQMQAAADGSAMAAAGDLSKGLGSLGIPVGEAEASATAVAVEIAAANHMCDRESIYLDGKSGTRFGQVIWNSATGTYDENWGATPYNALEVTLLRTDSNSGGNGALHLFFAPVIGHNKADIAVRAVAGLLPGTGFRPKPGGVNAPVLPIAYDLESWEIFLHGADVDYDYSQHGNGFREDNFKYDPDTGEMKPGSDGVLEIDLYPGNSELTAGNRGALMFGPDGTNDLSRQIVDGLSVSDLADFGGAIDYANVPIKVNGNPGLKAAIADPLNAIRGQPVALPIFSKVVDNGHNATYTIVRFVAVRVMFVELTTGNKRVTIQPAGSIVHETVVPGTGSVENSEIFTPVRLLR